MKATDIVLSTMHVLPSISNHTVLKQGWRDNADPAPNVCTSSCNESGGRSGGYAAT